MSDIEVQRLSTGWWHIRGAGPCNWAQPPHWPCSEEVLREHAFPEASEEFIHRAAMMAAGMRAGGIAQQKVARRSRRRRVEAMSSEDILAWWRAEAEVERTRRLFNGKPRLVWEEDDGWYFGCGDWNDRLTWNVIGPFWSYDEAFRHVEHMRNVVIALHTLGQAGGAVIKAGFGGDEGYHPHHPEVEL